GFILKEPMDSRGAQRFADNAGISFQGAPFYDVARRQLLAEQRFIPIEAFGYWLTHGDLRNVVAQYAPDLIANADPSGGAVPGTEPAPKVSSSRKVVIIIVAALLVAAGIVIAVWHSDAQIDRILLIPLAVILFLSATRNIISVVQFL